MPIFSRLLKQYFAIAFIAGAAGLLSAPAAKAISVSTNEYTFSFTGKDVWIAYSVSGTLTVSSLADSNSVGGLGYDIVGITGLVTAGGPFGGSINGLSPTFPGRTPDNYLYLAGPYFDNNGVAFTTVDGSIWNIYGSDPMAIYVGPPNNFVFTDAALGNILVAGPGIGATPLPAALPLFAGGLGVIGLLARRRKQKNAVLAAT